MSALPKSLYLSDDVREIDRIAIEEANIPGITLMERAGKDAWCKLKETWPTSKQIIVICGAGNNAGDGYVLAKLAADEDYDVTVMYLSSPNDLHGDAQTAYTKCTSSSDICKPFNIDQLVHADVIVDAIFGTGLSREVTGAYKQAISAINQSGIPILAIDIPSGLNADTGSVMGIAVKADVTISFIGLKAGLMTNDGPEYSGQLVYSDLEVPEDVYTKVTPVANRIDMTGLAGGMTKRHKNSHKGRYGHVLIVGGDYGYPGAIRIAAEASLRAGAGLVSVATRPEYASMIPMTLPEVMATAITSPTDLNPLLATASVVAIGPGLGQDEWGMNLLSKVVESGLPMVVDADALNLIAMEKFACSRWVLTPHPGEAGRLTGSNSDDVQQDRLNACQNLQNVYDGVVVLKGCGTVICDQDQNLTICTDGNPGMASGGMGDCLTGVIAGLLAQGLSLDMAAKLGVCIHAAAADKAALDGERGLMASDLMPWIRHFANH